VAFGDDSYEPNFKNWNYKYDSYTRSLVGRSCDRCLHKRLLLSGCAMRFTNRQFGCALCRALLRGVAEDLFLTCWCLNILSVNRIRRSCAKLSIGSVLEFIC
jgi:hypothetical protein